MKKNEKQDTEYFSIPGKKKFGLLRLGDFVDSNGAERATMRLTMTVQQAKWLGEALMGPWHHQKQAETQIKRTESKGEVSRSDVVPINEVIFTVHRASGQPTILAKKRKQLEKRK